MAIFVSLSTRSGSTEVHVARRDAGDEEGQQREDRRAGSDGDGQLGRPVPQASGVVVGEGQDGAGDHAAQMGPPVDPAREADQYRATTGLPQLNR